MLKQIILPTVVVVSLVVLQNVARADCSFDIDCSGFAQHTGVFPSTPQESMSQLPPQMLPPVVRPILPRPAASPTRAENSTPRSANHGGNLMTPPKPIMADSGLLEESGSAARFSHPKAYALFRNQNPTEKPINAENKDRMGASSLYGLSFLTATKNFITPR